MKDLHCHILYGIDDGAKTIEDSIEILKHAEEEGIKEIVCTPHYIKDTKYNANNKEKEKRFQKLQEQVKKEKLNIELYLGNEIMLEESVIDLIEQKEIKTINNSRYVLVEFLMRNENNNYEDLLFELIRNNYIPILAHPERYTYIQDDPKKLDKYLDLGIILQGNYFSLLNRYGRKAKKTLKRLLKEDKIKILASDIHRPTTEYSIEKLEKKLKRIIRDKEKRKELLEDNFDKIIHNLDI